MTRRTRRRECIDAARPENELDSALRSCIEHAHAGIAPAVQGAVTRVAAGDTAGGNGQSRAARLYPLGIRPQRTGLPAHDHHVVDEPRRQARQQFPFGRRVEIAGQQQRVAAGRDPHHAILRAAAGGENLQHDAIPIVPRIAAVVAGSTGVGGVTPSAPLR